MDTAVDNFVDCPEGKPEPVLRRWGCGNNVERWSHLLGDGGLSLFHVKHSQALDHDPICPYPCLLNPLLAVNFYSI